MALFKVFRGKSTELNNVTKVDGYAYFCTDDGSFWIDYKTSDGSLNRKRINEEELKSIGEDLEELKKSLNLLLDDEGATAVIDSFKEVQKALEGGEGTVGLITQVNENTNNIKEISESYVDLNSNQSIEGIKTFYSRTSSGAVSIDGDKVSVTNSGDECGVQVTPYGITYLLGNNSYNFTLLGESGTLATQEWTTTEIDNAVKSLLGGEVDEAYDTFKEIQALMQADDTATAQLIVSVNQNTANIKTQGEKLDTIEEGSQVNTIEQISILNRNGVTVSTMAGNSEKRIAINSAMLILAIGGADERGRGLISYDDQQKIDSLEKTYQPITDETLSTTDKTVSGAINELKTDMEALIQAIADTLPEIVRVF